MYKVIIDFGSCAVKIYIYELVNTIYKEVYIMRFKLNLINLVIDGEIDRQNVFFIDWAHAMRVIENYKVKKSDIHIYATSILRTYSHANELCGILEKEYNIKIHILQGEDEAGIVAKGVISATPYVDGVVIDLGGGSIEFMYVYKNKIMSVKSYELSKNVIQNFEHLITEFCQVKNIYLVGGLLRVVAKKYMNKISYPLGILHNFSSKTERFLKYVEFILDNKLYLSNELLGYEILRIMLNNTTAKNVIVSSYGLKEGLKITKLMNLKKDIFTYNENIKMMRANFIGVIKDELVSSYVNNILKIFNLEKDLLWINLIEDYITFMSFKLGDFDSSTNKKSLSNYILYTTIPYTHKYRLMLYILINGDIDLLFEEDEIISKFKHMFTKKDIIYLNIIYNMLFITFSIQGTFLIKSQVCFKKEDDILRFIFYKGKISSYIFRSTLKKMKYINDKIMEVS